MSQTMDSEDAICVSVCSKGRPDAAQNGREKQQSPNTGVEEAPQTHGKRILWAACETAQIM